MAYATVAQVEHEATYLDPTSVVNSPSPVPEIHSRPLSIAFAEASGDVLAQNVDAPPLHTQTGVGLFLQSITSSNNYEMVEADDYEELDQQQTPRGKRQNEEATRSPVGHQNDEASMLSEQPPVRTASIRQDLPLNCPTPDLQSMQGAYVKNVERLEESAERLSMTSSLEEELQKMKLDQRRLERQSSAPAGFELPRPSFPHRQFSTSSLSNSILGVNNTARSGGYSPSGYITSPTGSIRSGGLTQPAIPDRRPSRTSRLGPQPELAGPQTESADQYHTQAQDVVQGQSTERSVPLESTEPPINRSSTSASSNTYRQANDLFTDFDGVHCGQDLQASLGRSGSISRHISLNHPPRARDSKAFKEPQPGERMIYYPAPVPVMLNLPQKLSKTNFADREKRRLQALSSVTEDMRKSAPWLANEDALTSIGPRSSYVPPQLRANAFFEQPSAATNLELKNGSAVATLDSILDAAAYAPVSAFTDHPIGGPVGREVYGTTSSPRKNVPAELSKKRRSSLSTLLKSRRSSTALSQIIQSRVTSRESKVLDADEFISGDELDQAAAQSLAPGDDEIVDEADGSDLEMSVDEVEQDHRPAYSGAPTTLLAELQLRKAQQKQRNRTAAKAFPHGMHSTLLEQDAVTQLQQKARRQKHVALAWEDQEAVAKDNFDDDDVPLGVLFPEKERATHFNVHKPVGLLEKREIEENEPLSYRRARLRGESVQVARTRQSVRASEQGERPDRNEVIDFLASPVVDEQEGETLGQRRKRIKEANEKASAEGFAAEVSSQLGLDHHTSIPLSSKTPDAEETLGQRRRRMKEEARKNARNISANSTNHALRPQVQAHPVGAARQVSSESRTSNPQVFHSPAYDPVTPHGQRGFDGVSMPAMPAHFSTIPYYPSNMPYMTSAFNTSMPMVLGGIQPLGGPYEAYGYPYNVCTQAPYLQGPMMGPPLEPKQRAMIDQWRQSVL